MATRPQDLFTEQDLQRINEALAQLDTAQEIIEMGKQAGLDVEQQEERAREQRNQLLRLKNTFFPGR